MKQLILLSMLLLTTLSLWPMDHKHSETNHAQRSTASHSSAEKNKKIIRAGSDIELVIQDIDFQAPNFHDYLEMIRALEPTLTDEQISYLKSIILAKYESVLRIIAKPGLDSLVLNGKILETRYDHKPARRSAEELQPVIESFKKSTKVIQPDYISTNFIGQRGSWRRFENQQLSVLRRHRSSLPEADTMDEKNYYRDCYWHLENYDATPMGVDLPFDGSKKTIHDIAISPNGKYIIAGSDDHSVYLWDRDADKVTTLLHYGSIRSVDISADNKYAVTGSFDKTIRIWHLESQKSGIWTYRHPVRQLRFSEDNKYLIVGEHHNLIALNIENCDLLQDLSLAQLLLLIKLITQKDYDNELKIEAFKRVYQTLKNYPVLKQRLRNNLAVKLLKNNLQAPNEIANLIVGYITDVPAKKKVVPESAAQAGSGCVIS